MKHLSLKITALVAFIVFVGLSQAQDIIVTNKKQKIDAKILEVSTSEIRYKELDNLEGPVFVLKIDEIDSIIYANGKVVAYSQSFEKQIEKARTEAIARANTLESQFSNNTNPCEAWGLNGRSLRGTLPQPSIDFREEGNVVVQIRVNAAGDVIEAKCVEGTTVADKYTQQLALNAAKKAKFTEGDKEQIGTITYVFKMK